MRKQWFLIASSMLLMALLVVSCGIPQDQYDAVAADLDKAQQELQSVKAELAASQSKVSELTSSVEKSEADLEATQVELEAANTELTELKKVYPPRYFSTVKELKDWLLANDVSERPAATNAENLYAKALEIQEDALEDGYIVSAWIDYYFDEEMFYVNCTAVANGYVWMWAPETDEPVNFSDATGLLKLS